MPLSEEQLVDWIDGNVSPEDASRLARSSGRPDLAGRVAQMQRQKAVLASVEDEQAPAELYDRVMAAVERDVLLGVARAPSPDIVEPRLQLAGVETGVGARATRALQGNMPRFALAAGLLLMAGGLAYFGSIAYQASKKPLVKIAQNDPSGTSNTPGSPVAGGTRSVAEDRGVANEGTAHGGAAPEGAAPQPVSVAQEPTLREVGVDEAVALAAEGRLAIRVLAQKPENMARIERDVSKPTGERQWRLTRGVPAEVVAAVVPARQGSSAPTVASGHSALSLISPFIGPGAAISMLTAAADPLARVKGTFLVDVPATREQLNVVATVFKNQLGAAVVFEELPSPVDAPSIPQAQDLLWWTQPSGQWVPRATVPLVVEQRYAR
ncbi:MAG: hypothetical protein U0637_00170 [Phycisphaerales bacterium]